MLSLGGKCIYIRKEFGFALNFEAGESWCGCGPDGSPTRMPERSQLPAYDNSYVADGLFQHVEYLGRNTQSWSFKSPTSIVPSLSLSQQAS
jgi:hypothetical protein